MNTGKMILSLRKAEGLTQEALAKTLGITRVYLSQVENSRVDPSINFLKKTANYFKLPLPLLLVDEIMDDYGVYKELHNMTNEILSLKVKLMKEKHYKAENERPEKS